MRRVILALAATAAALVLLLTFKSHTQSAPAPAAALGAPTPGAGSAAGPGSAAPGASGTARPGTPRAGATTVTGAAWPTVYGPVQVRITLAGGKITAAAATEYPTETERDAQINAFAIPELNAEAVAAGSAKIDAVSGATYTSQGYLGSLQSALDKARGGQALGEGSGGSGRSKAFARPKISAVSSGWRPAGRWRGTG